LSVITYIILDGEISALHKLFYSVLIVLEIYLSVACNMVLVVLCRILQFLLCLLLSIYVLINI